MINTLSGLFSPPQEADIIGTLLEKYLDLAIRAHNGVSHSPERRGKQYIKEYSDLLVKDLEHVSKYGGDAVRYQEKFERLFCAWMSAKSRCLSANITGPSGFPVRRAEKANRSEDNRYREFSEWRTKALAAIAKSYHKAQQADVDSIQQVGFELQMEKGNVERMKAANKILRSKKLSTDEKVEAMKRVGFTAGQALTLLEPDCFGIIGFAPFSLTNANARIRSKEARLAELERRAATEAKETERPDGIMVVDNAQENRLQVFFPGKPDEQVRSQLKRSGFRWSPTNGCWQAYLNAVAKEKLNRILEPSKE